MIRFEGDREDLRLLDPHLIQPLGVHQCASDQQQQQPSLDDLYSDKVMNAFMSLTFLPRGIPPRAATRLITDPVTIRRACSQDSATNSTAFSDEQRQQPSPSEDTVHMEQYINLEMYMTTVPAVKMEYYYTDELNTPDFIDAPKEVVTNTTHQTQSVENPFIYPAIAPQQNCDGGDSSRHIDNEEQQQQQQQAGCMVMNANTFSEHLNNVFNSNNLAETDNSSIGAMAYGGVMDGGGEAPGSPLLAPDALDIDVNMDEYDMLLDWNEALAHVNANNYDEDVAIDEEVEEQVEVEEKKIIYVEQQQPEVRDVHQTINEHNYPLKFNFAGIGGALLDAGDVPQTPDIINTILLTETERELRLSGTYVTVDDIKEECPNSSPSVSYEPPSSPEATLDESSCSQSSSMLSLPSTSTGWRRGVAGRRRKKESDDEDYVPPSAKRGRKRTSKVDVIKEEEDDDDDVEEEVEERPPPPKRGRPAKPVTPRSSDSSEASKYREMRDKNNEASRRSRRKRRQQELNIDREKETLLEHNTRLKAQVADLESQRDTYQKYVMDLLKKSG